MKTEKEIREMRDYWQRQYDESPVEVLKPSIRMVITALNEVLGD